MGWLLGIDTQILFFINGLHSPFLDQVMWQLSHTLVSIPLYVYFIYLFYKVEGKNLWRPLLAIVLVVVLADRISVECFKDVVCRLRPSHTVGVMEHLHFYIKSTGEAYVGGQYGFVSSHAANTFGVATFVAFFAKRRFVSILAASWAVLVSLSRVYLGVHFPTDVLVGGALGVLIGWGCYLAYQKLIQKYGSVN